MTPQNDSPTFNNFGTTTTTTSASTTSEAGVTSPGTDTDNRNINTLSVLCLTTESTPGVCKRK